MGRARGALARGESGLIRLAKRFARALYLLWNLHVGWGILLGDTESPSVSPCVSSFSARAWMPTAARGLTDSPDFTSIASQQRRERGSSRNFDSAHISREHCFVSQNSKQIFIANSRAWRRKGTQLRI
jgi:hypothetical protein